MNNNNFLTTTPDIPREALSPSSNNDQSSFMSYNQSNENFTFWKVFFGLMCFGIVVLIGLTSGTLGVGVNTNDKVDDGSFSSTQTTGLDLNLLQLIESNTEQNQVSSIGLSIRPLPVCIEKCRTEFCQDIEEGQECSFSKCNLIESVTFQDCVNGCTCCDAYTICLTERQAADCQQELSNCNFSDYPYPPQTPPVCFGTKTTSNCPWLGVGFNNPVTVESV